MCVDVDGVLKRGGDKIGAGAGRAVKRVRHCEPSKGKKVDRGTSLVLAGDRGLRRVERDDSGSRRFEPTAMRRGVVAGR